MVFFCPPVESGQIFVVFPVKEWYNIKANAQNFIYDLQGVLKMPENKDYMTHPEQMGSIHISEEVLATIAAGAAAEVEGVDGLMNLAGKKAGVKGVRLSVNEGVATVNLYVMIRYGYPIPEVAEKIQTAVVNAVEAMTGFPVSAVNVHVGGVSLQ